MKKTLNKKPFNHCQPLPYNMHNNSSFSDHVYMHVNEISQIKLPQ